MSGAVGSFNVSVVGGLLKNEIVRQRAAQQLECAERNG